MRCQIRGEPRHVLTQVSVVLLWLLHIVTCQDHPPLTSSASGAGRVTVDPTPVTIGISATKATEWSVGSGGHIAGDGQRSPSPHPVTVIDSSRDGELVLQSSRPIEESVTETGIADSDTHVPVSPTEIRLFPSEGAAILPSSSFTLSSPTSSLPELTPLHSTSHRTTPLVSSTSLLTSTIESEIIYNSKSSDISPSSTEDETLTFSSLQTTSVADVPPPSATTLPLQGDELGESQITTPSVVSEPNSTTSQTNITMDVSYTNSSNIGPTPALPPNMTHNIVHVDVMVTGGEGHNVTFSDMVTPSGEMWNQTSVLPPGDDGEDEGLSVGATVGISVACVLVVVSGVLVGLAILYHRHRSRKLDTTKTQTNHYTGLWDDNVTLSYINNHFDFFQKDAQDEMISLDNDAYLNSLEFMVFTNTWGDGKRNTRF